MTENYGPGKVPHGKEHEAGKGPNEVADLLRVLVGLQVSQNSLLAGLSGRLDTAICVLERISKQTCEALNEAHAQTKLQALSKEWLGALVELEKVAHPESALVCEKLGAMRKELLACCPPEEEPEPPCCVYRPCEPCEEGGGSAVSKQGSAPPNKVFGAPYPPAKRPCDPVKNANKHPAPRIPSGPFRGFLPAGSEHKPLNFDEGGGGAGGDDPVVFGTYTNYGTTASPLSTVAADISGAQSGNVVLSSGNWYAAYSTDAGSTFTSVDPTTVFDNTADGGFCCDQIIQYVPSIDRFIWLMQFTAGTNGKNRVRIAAASPETLVSSKCTSWTYWDLTEDTFGITNGMDYPNLSVGNNYLYFSIDEYTAGRLVVRISLSDIAAGGTINFSYTDPTKSASAFGSHVSQNTGDTLYWAGNKNNSTLQVFDWPESTGTYSWRDVGVSNWPNGTLSSTAPNSGSDWLTKAANFPNAGVIGATVRTASEVWFAWMASSGTGSSGGFNFPNANVQVVKVDPTNNYKVLDQFPIWNGSYAFAYPSLATNARGEVGIALGWGGDTTYPSAAVGILGDFVVWYPEASTQATIRWGDYVTARQASPQTGLFAGFGYAILKDSTTTAGYRFDPWYVLFGRNSVVNPGGGSGGVR